MHRDPSTRARIHARIAQDDNREKGSPGKSFIVPLTVLD